MKYSFLLFPAVGFGFSGGGPLVTFCAEETLQQHADLDGVVIGEEEASLVELLRTFAATGDLNRVKGIAFREGTRVRRSPPRDPIDLNQLPLPARNLLPLGRYRALGLPLTVTPSRGCPHHYIFCLGRKLGGAKVRHRYPSAVAEELESLHRPGFRQINLADALQTAAAGGALAYKATTESIGWRWVDYLPH